MYPVAERKSGRAHLGNAVRSATICFANGLSKIRFQHRLQDNENELLEQIDRMEAAQQTVWIVFSNF